MGLGMALEKQGGVGGVSGPMERAFCSESLSPGSACSSGHTNQPLGRLPCSLPPLSVHLPSSGGSDLWWSFLYNMTLSLWPIDWTRDGHGIQSVFFCKWGFEMVWGSL